MKFYFCNSYQGSFAGYQIAEIEGGDRMLHQKDAGSLPERVRSCLSNSGMKCILYRDRDGSYGMGIRGLQTEEPKGGRKWYVNLAVKAEEGELSRFLSFVYRYFLEHTAFLKEISSWFTAEPECRLSYSLDADRLNRYMSQEVSPRLLKERLIQPYCADIRRYRKALTRMEYGWKKGEIYLLVGESVQTYFRKQNPAFDGMPIRYFMDGREFARQLSADRACFAEKHRPAGKDIDEETAAAVVCVILTILALAGLAGVIRDLFREE